MGTMLGSITGLGGCQQFPMEPKDATIMDTLKNTKVSCLNLFMMGFVTSWG
jgi:hypothetical protein